jgi:hypothetical protein
MTFFQKLVPIGLLVLLPCGLGQVVSACSGALRTIDDLNQPSDDWWLKFCREQGRVDKALHDDAGGAYQIYVDCTKDAGLR